MQNFADQCLDLAQTLLEHNLPSINDNGTVSPIEGEESRIDEPGHAAHAIGEYYRATGNTELAGTDLIDLAARCITAQAFLDENAHNGLASAALGLLSFGPAKERNLIWERLMDETQQMLDERLMDRTDFDSHLLAFSIAKAVARHSMGLTKKDDTGRLIDSFIEKLQKNSTLGYFDESPSGLGGAFNLRGVQTYVTIRQSLQLTANISLRERKLPTLRTHAEKYIKLIPDLVRADGLCWAFGSGVGAYGQMYCISLLLQALRDGWVDDNKKAKYLDALRRMFQNFFMSYIDQEHGVLVIRDNERTTVESHTTRMANFDAVRFLCQWARLAKSIGGDFAAVTVPEKNTNRFVFFDKSSNREHGVLVYKNAKTGLAFQLPLISNSQKESSDALAFPHSPGVFDWPANKYLPVMLPELTIEGHKITPSFYGKKCTSGLGARNAFVFKYEQPEVINSKEEMVNKLGSWKVSWTLKDNEITAEYIFIPQRPVQLDKFRFMMAIAAPHSQFHLPNTQTLGEGSHGLSIEHDDFQAAWAELHTVSEDPEYRSYYGKIHYLQSLERNHAMQLRAGQSYKLVAKFVPDVKSLDQL